MRWLFVTVDFPWPILRGSCVRTYNLTRTLSKRGEEVSLLSFVGVDEGIKAYQDNGVNLIDIIRDKPLLEGPSAVRFGPFVYQKPLADRIKKYAREFDVVFLVNSESLQYAPLARAAKFVIANVADDPVVEVLRRLKRFPKDKFWYYLKFALGHFFHEYAFVKYTDAITFVSERDAFTFSLRHPRTNIHFIHNGADPEYYYPQETQSVESMDVVFTGNMTHFPNIDAAEYIAEEIAPRVWRRLSSVKFNIVGYNPPERLRRYCSDKFRLLGFVDDIRPFLWKSLLVLVPMRVGTGIKNKILEAWSAQRAVIATPLACQGLPVVSGKNILIGSNSEELADWVVQTVEDESLRTRIAQAGRKTVIEKMTWEKVVDKYLELINDFRVSRS